jgi:hypothetical protein
MSYEVYGQETQFGLQEQNYLTYVRTTVACYPTQQKPLTFNTKMPMEIIVI